jgi:pyruvate/2-oxoglutarate dehydrogenase complex dihydrolipoamide acyltransferase (E2) component
MIELQACMTVQGKSAHGDLLAVYDWIGVGVELKGAKSDTHLTGARRWYESRHAGAAAKGAGAKAEAESKPAGAEAEPEAKPAKAEPKPAEEKKPNWFQRTFSGKK